MGKHSPKTRKCTFLAVSKREKGVWDETTRHPFIDGMRISLFYCDPSVIRR